MCINQNLKFFGTYEESPPILETLDLILTVSLSTKTIRILEKTQ